MIPYYAGGGPSGGVGTVNRALMTGLLPEREATVEITREEMARPNMG